MAPDITSDADLVRNARATVGASDVGAIPDDAIHAALAAVKETVEREVQQALDGGTINLYDDQAELDLARRLLYLRVHNLMVEAGRTTSEEGRVPTGVGALRRHDFTDRNLAYHRDEMVRAFNRLTDGS